MGRYKIPIALIATGLFGLLSVAAVFFSGLCLTQTQLSLVSAAATLLGILVAAGMIVWQQRDGARTRFMLDRYENARRSLLHAQDAVSDYASFVRFLPTDLLMHEAALEQHGSAMPPASRFPEFQRRKDLAGRATADAIDRVASCEAVFPDAELLRKALFCAAHDAEQEAQSLLPLLMRALPVDLPQGVFNDGSQPAEVIERIRLLSTALLSVVEDLRYYLEDADNDLVRGLVGELFGNKAQPRKPADSRLLVLSTVEPHKTKLRQWLDAHPVMQQNQALSRWAAAREDHE